MDYPVISVIKRRYRLRASGFTRMSHKTFYENANDPNYEKLFELDDVAIGEVVKIDTGLSKHCFYCIAPNNFKVAHFCL